MSLLNSKTISNYIGRLDSKLTNIVDHFPKSSLISIVKRGITSINNVSAAREHFIAYLTSDDALFTDDVVEKGVAYTSVNELRAADLLDSEIELQLDVNRDTALINALTSIYAGVPYVIFPYGDDRRISLKNGDQQVSFNPNLSPRKWFGYDSETHVLTVRAVVCLIDEQGNFSYAPSFNLLCYWMKWRDPTHYDDIFSSLLKFRTFVTGPAEKLVHGMSSMLYDEANESLSEFLKKYDAQDGNLDHIVNFTDSNGKGYALFIKEDTYGNAFAAFWNDNPATPFVINCNDKRVVLDVAYSIDRVPISLPDLLKSLVISNEINDFISTCGLYVTNGLNDVTGLAQDLNAKASQWSDATRKIIPSALNAFRTSGLTGLATYITGFFSTTSSVEVDATDASFKYTDASLWVPQDYISGFANAAATLLSTLGTAIAAIGSKIIGAAIALIGAALKLGHSFLTADWDSAKFQFVDEENAIPNCAPYATLKGETNVDVHINQFSCFEDMMCYYCKVPCGYILFGPGTVNSNTQQPETIRWEFHPDLYDRTKLAHKLLVDTDIVNHITVSSVDDDYCKVKFNYNAEHTFFIDTLLQYVNDADYCADFISIHAGEIDNDGHVSPLASRDFALTIACNTALFMTLHCADGNNFSAMGDNSQGIYVVMTNTVAGYYYTTWASQDAVISLSVASILLGAAMRYLHESSPVTSIGAWLNTVLGITSFNTYQQQWVDTCGSSASNYAKAASCVCEWFTARWVDNDLTIIFEQQLFADEPIPLPLQVKYVLKAPQYTMSSIQLAIGIAAAVTVVTVIAVVVATKIAKQKINTSRALSTAKVEQAWTTLAQHPTPENATAYYKATKRHNFMSRFLGSSKVALSGYWDTAPGSAVAAGAVASSALAAIAGGDDGQSIVSSLLSQENSVDINRVYESIVG